MRLGFIGTGTITASIVTGLGTGFGKVGEITVSPRGAATAASLARRFAHVHVASTNQDVLDRSDLVVLALLPQVAAEVLDGLRFRPDHNVVSLIATYPAERLRALVAPARQLTKAVPLPSVAFGKGPTAIFPPDSVAAALFGRIGLAVEVDSPDVFDALTAVTATMASYFRFMGTIAHWAALNGVPPEDARNYVAAMFEGLAATARRGGTPDFDALATGHATPGGLNEGLVRRLTTAKLFAELGAGLDSILARIRAPRPG